MSEGKYEKSAACYRFEEGLPAYLEGGDLPAVPAHAKECPFCRVVLTDHELIRSECRLLPLEEPPQTLWANIRAQLAAERVFSEPSSGWRRWFEGLGALPNPAPVAVMACLVILGSVILFRPATVERNQPFQSISNQTEAMVTIPTDWDQNGALARTVNDLESNYAAREPSLEPAVKATYRKSLKSLNSSIRECLDSIHREPTNTLAREYLASAYQQKAEVLASAIEFDAR